MPLSLAPSNSLTYEVVGTIDLPGAEISAFDAATQRLFATSNFGLQVIDLSDASNPALITTINLATLYGFGNDVTSVAVKNGIVAISVTAPVRTDPGKVFLFDTAGNLLNTLTVGAVPDMVTFTPDGSKILVANEAEASFDTVLPRVDPEGSVSVIDLSGGAAAATVQTAGFGDFNDDAAALAAAGVRLFSGVAGFTVAKDLEPEYIAVAPDGLSAVITLQEANAIALLDLSGPTPVITEIVPLGLKEWDGLGFDGTDRDGPPPPAAGSPIIQFEFDRDIFGMYMPDAIASFSAGGETYYIMANEGDDRNDFLAPDETANLSTRTLDPTVYPAILNLKNNAELGRLTVPALSGLNGDTDGDGDVDQILTYGGRSFSIVDAAGNLVFESGDQIDRFVAEYFSSKFDDTRSDNKGSEPEGATVAVIDGHTFAFINLERFNGTMVYDITDPENPVFSTFLFNDGDVAPEGGLFIPGADSPTGDNLYVVSNEGGGGNSPSVTIYRIVEPQTEGGNGQDDMVGTIVDDEMTGGNGDDYLSGNTGDDQLYGENGDDILLGGIGDDLLAGGRGNDRLTGGSGEDIFVVGKGGGVDVVTDFNTDLDQIALTDGVTSFRARTVDYDQDGTTDLLIQFGQGGGALILIGVSDAGEVQIGDLV